MGATKEIALAETERTINCTFKVSATEENGIMDYLHTNTKVVDYQVVPDTNWLYENDPQFKKIAKQAKKAKKEKQEYINKHNK